MMELEIYNYWIYITIMMVGFYGVIAKPNLVKKIISLGIFQTGIFLLYLSMAVRRDAVAPILDDSAAPLVYTNPLPHVLILTAIVVSVATSAVALSIVVGVKQSYGTIECDEIDAIDRQEREY